MMQAQFILTLLFTALAVVPAIAQTAKPAGSEDGALAKLESRLRQLDEIKLCIGLGVAVRDKKLPPSHVAVWERSAKSRKAALEKDFVPAIYRRELAMQMSECDVLASLGMPSAVNTTRYSGGIRRQLIFDKPRRYVYVTNSSVTSWQE